MGIALAFFSLGFANLTDRARRWDGMVSVDVQSMSIARLRRVVRSSLYRNAKSSIINVLMLLASVPCTCNVRQPDANV